MEGESVPYRLRLSSLTPGATSHSLTLEWDTTANSGGSAHALDYVTTFNRTETTANPCSGVAGCALGTFTTAAIPTDARVTKGNDGLLGTADDIVQIPGVFTLFGGTITSVSPYTVAGSYSGASQTSVVVTFTASIATPVLSWSGHVASRADWNPGTTAVEIDGSPYHTRLLALDGSGGNQDRGLSAEAVHKRPEVVVIKHVINDSGGTRVASDFTMIVSGPTPLPPSAPGAASPGVVFQVGPGSYSVTETGPSGYQATYSAGCSGTIDYDQTFTCIVTNDDVSRCAGVTCAPPASECLMDGVCDANTGTCTYAPKTAGTPCTDDGNVCTGDVCDAAGTCSHPAGHAGVVCRDASDACDVAEVCDGAQSDCPGDGYASATEVCRAAEGVCDLEERCTGDGPACPADVKSQAECRASAGSCDVAEVCDGSANACPADGFASAATECRASAGVCDVGENCTGNSAVCPDDGFRASTTECRGSGGICDVAENCTGQGAACPDDGFEASTTECRGSGGICDVAENCTGQGAGCPDDGFKASTTECRSSGGICDVAENCTGQGAACPDDGFKASTTECRGSGGICDVAENCTGQGAACPDDGFKASSTECRGSGGICDVAENCTGQGAACPDDGFKASSTECRGSGGICDEAENCTGQGAACPDDGFKAITTECRGSEGVCDVAENCTGQGAACPEIGRAHV